MLSPRYLALANPDGKRWQTYQRDLADFWQQRGLQPEIAVVPWRELVPRLGCLDGLSAFDRPALVRLESPGRDFEVTKLLLQAGDPGGEWADLPYRKGHLLRPSVLHRGFCRVLNGLRSSFEARPHLKPLACPSTIAELFDKNATSARLRAAGIPCPPSLEAPATPQELLAELRSRRWPTAYVKVATGSSASGIAVVHALDAEPWAVTSVVCLDDGFYNTRRLRRIAGEELQATLAFLLSEGTCVQLGIPMPQLDGQNFDVRVVMIRGEPAIVVFRLSSQPMTNLHLGGRRGRTEECRAAIPTRVWLDAMDHCVEASRLYDCAVLGIDLLFERGYVRHFILEMNAFGDFFPGLRDPSGRTVHAIEIEATARELSR